MNGLNKPLIMWTKKITNSINQNMKFSTLVLLLLTGCSNMSKKIIVSGTVSDFYNHQLNDADVNFQDENFKPLYSTKTDSEGKFSIEIEDRKYGSVFICKDYSKTFLEYWHWGFQPSVSSKINAKIDGLEVYGMKAWSTLPAYSGLIVYFRPMSLSKYKKLVNPDKNKAAQICPDLTINDIEASVNNEKVKILGLNSVKEFMQDGQSMGAYLLHLSISDIKLPVKTICIKLKDQNTNEFGMGCLDL